MSKSKEYNLRNIGIENPLNLCGSIKILTDEIPTVFLIDEEHHNEKGTENNIANAIELITKANVQIIGIESQYGGTYWIEFDEKYSDDDIFDKGKDVSLTNDYTVFADSLRNNYDKYIYGVESFEIASKLECSKIEGDIKDHPLNIKRSEHMIRTLFEHRTRNKIEGNLILNCGCNHNTHIQEWFKSGEIDNITKVKANYVRINAIDKSN